MTTSTLGLIAVMIGIVGYIPYIKDMYHGITKPHPFTWFGIGLLNGIAFFAQIFSGGGAGAWISGITAIFTIAIATFSLRSKTEIKPVDWICLVGALLAIVFWKLTSSPLTAVIVVTFADLLIMIPTFRKSFSKPNEETVSLYLLSFVKYALSLMALGVFNLTTALFPAVIAFLNLSLVALIFVRRNQKVCG